MHTETLFCSYTGVFFHFFFFFAFLLPFFPEFGKIKKTVAFPFTPLLLILKTSGETSQKL